MNVPRRVLFGKLGTELFRAIESATAFAKLRGNPYVELVHWLHQLWQLPGGDLHRIATHYQLDAAQVEKDLVAALSRLPSGASGVHDFSHHIESATLDTRLVIENVAEASQRGVVALSDALRLSGAWRVLVEFEVQPVTQALRPLATQRKPKTGGPETALVVGPVDDTAASNIYTDGLGRIKVQFPWDRYGGKNQNSSCWVRVASEFAGNQLGAMHLPRIGQEVVVSFLGGDPDLPLVTGRAFNQLNLPPWQLPDQQALSGFRSRELVPGGGNSAAGRSNHVLLDDTDGLIQVQLKSDHQSSSLSLGHITRVEDNAGRKDARGQGLELRTDGHGVLRAQDGLLISAEARNNAQAHVKDMGETTARLAEAQDQHQSLGNLAKQHRAQDDADQPGVAHDLQAQNDAIAGSAGSAGSGQATGPQAAFPELNAPHITLASPAGIASTTPGSTHQHSGQHHAITSAWHTSIAASKSLLASAREAVRMFAYREGIKLVSAKGDIDMQALQTSVHLLAKMDITMTASRITLTAKEQVSINGGGSYTQWSAAGIRSHTIGVHAVHATDFGHAEQKSVAVVMPSLPFVPEPAAFSARVDASPIQTAMYLPDNVREMNRLSVSVNAKTLAKMSGLDRTAPGYVYAKDGEVADALLKTGEAWVVESEFLDSSEA